MEELKEVYEELRMYNDDAIEHLEKELAKIRAGRANASMVTGVMVDYYGSPTALNQVATVNTPDARTIAIKPFEKKSLQDIEKAIFGANLGFTPQNDGETIRINIPMLTEERRIELAKQIKSEGEHGKISLRNSRKHANDAIKVLNKEGLSDDLAKDAEAEVDKFTHQYADKIKHFVDAKEKEIMTV